MVGLWPHFRFDLERVKKVQLLRRRSKRRGRSRRHLELVPPTPVVMRGNVCARPVPMHHGRGPIA